MMKYTEILGTICGIIGALLVASKHGMYGYPFFLASSVGLMFAAIVQKQKNFIVLQAVYFCTNSIGFYNYVMA
jgi:hypothetical protein